MRKSRLRFVDAKGEEVPMHNSYGKEKHVDNATYHNFYYVNCQAYCRNIGGSLVEIDDAPEDHFIRRNLRPGNVTTSDMILT